ncbi:MAG: hypothetical protein ACREQD_02765, partial [Candidatus Binataceae bacterium]
PVAGAIGEAQAAEALSWLGGKRPALTGRMLAYNGKTGSFRVSEIAARSGCGCGAAAKTNPTAAIAGG